MSMSWLERLGKLHAALGECFPHFAFVVVIVCVAPVHVLREC